MGNAMNRLAEAAKVIADAAKRLAPVGKDISQGKGKWSERKAGALRDSIRVVRLHGDPKRNVRIYAGSRAVFYARFVEYGTVKMKAKPYLRPAFRSSRGKVMEILQNG